MRGLTALLLLLVMGSAAPAQDAPRIDELLRCDPERAMRLPVQSCQRNPAVEQRELAAAWADWQARNQAAADAVRRSCRQQWRLRAGAVPEADALAPYERAYRSLDQLTAAGPPFEAQQCVALARGLREDVVHNPQAPASAASR